MKQIAASATDLTTGMVATIYDDGTTEVKHLEPDKDDKPAKKMLPIRPQ
jgi:hypothetical protein